MKTGWMILFVALGLMACRDAGNSPEGALSLRVRYAQDFDPNAVNAEVIEYRVTVFSDALETPVYRVFPAGTTSATFNGFVAGTQVNVLVEYVNGDGAVVRRGRSEPVAIQAGMDTPADVTVNNVPIFTNVKDGATVVSSRFVPRVFAPGIAFQIEDGFNGADSLLPDLVSGEISFSIGEGETPVRPVYVPPLQAGEHVLSVHDPVSGESSSARIRVVEREGLRALTTTAGGYAGSILSEGNEGIFNLERYFRHLTGE